MSGDRLLTIFMALLVAVVFVHVRFKIGGIIVRPVDGLLIAGIGIAWLFWSKYLFKAFRHLFPILLGLLGSYGIRALSSTYYGMWSSVIADFGQAIEYSFFACMIAIATREPETRGRFFKVLCGTLFVIGVAAYIYLRLRGEIAGLKELGDYKYIYGVLCVLVVTQLFTGFWGKFRHYFYLIPAVALLLLSGERNAWAGLLGVFAVLVWSVRRNFSRKLIQRVLVGLILVVCVGTITGFILSETNQYFANQLNRFVEPFSLIDLRTGGIHYEEAESPSNRARLFQLDMSVQIFKEYPWFGVGTNRYFWFAYPYILVASPEYMTMMHGQYQMLLAENGIFAMFFWVLGWVMFFVVCHRTMRRASGRFKEWLLCVIALGTYGVIVNLFIGGGAANLIVFVLPVGLLGGLLMERAEARKAMRRLAIIQRGSTEPPIELRMPVKS